jgi:dTDP-4-dehydrorhamnose reductase
MRVLVTGGDGMLGHQVFKHLSVRHDVKVTLRQNLSSYQEYGLFDNENSYSGIDVRNLESILDVFADFQPQAVVNCVGIVKQRAVAKESIPGIEINSLLPHRLAVLCKSVSARLIHMSTDCVFSGKKGNYRECDPSDAEDLYGKSKYLGEVIGDNCLTLRTSIIGRELSRKKSLLEWFLNQKGTVKGYKYAIFSGLTTIEMSRIIEIILVNHPTVTGLYHVSSQPISKLDLLLKIKEALRLDTDIIADDSVRIDRSLESALFREKFNYQPPTWDDMIKELSKSKEIS